MPDPDLILIYKTVLQPILDNAAPTYHSMLTEGQRVAIERLQRMAYKIVYGETIIYEDKMLSITKICPEGKCGSFH